MKCADVCRNSRTHVQCSRCSFYVIFVCAVYTIFNHCNTVYRSYLVWQILSTVDYCHLVHCFQVGFLMPLCSLLLNFCSGCDNDLAWLCDVPYCNVVYFTDNDNDNENCQQWKNNEFVNDDENDNSKMRIMIIITITKNKIVQKCKW